MLALGLNIAALDQLNNTCRSAGDKAAAVLLAELADVDGVEAVDVFGRRDAIKGFGFVDMFGEWSLD